MTDTRPQTHPGDDELVLHFYGELPADERARIDAHLGACAACQAAWAEIRDTLRAADAVDVPEPPDGFERIVWARVSAALPPRRPLVTWRALVPLSAVAALVVAVVAGPRLWPTDRAAGGRAAVAPSAADIRDARERALFAALGGHFEQTELLLVELMNTPEPMDDGFEFARLAASDLVASGRLYRATAEETGHRVLAAMLEDLEPVLVEVARGPEHVDRETVRSLRARIDDEDLLFKVRAVSTDPRDR